jgi:hypothetical protein
MRTRRLIWACAPCLGLLIACGRAASEADAPLPPDPLPTHPAQLTSLAEAERFPRFHQRVLESAGYPDHKHQFAYPGYTPPVDAAGQAYGLRSLARGTQLLPRDGLEVGPGHVRYRHVHLAFPDTFDAVRMVPMVEALDWAEREVTALLGQARPDTLHVTSPLDLAAYGQSTGHGFHRLYWREGSLAIIEPAQVLFARGLALHAAFHLMTTWQLDHVARGQDLPRWFTEGLASYLAEDGVHFLSYLAMYRSLGPILLSPAHTEAVLAGPPHADQEVDKRQYRMAGYSAFLMIWELVEHRGGLERLRTFLQRIAAGEPADAVSGELWGHDLAGLARALDATARPEPVGEATTARATVNRPPEP